MSCLGQFNNNDNNNNNNNNNNYIPSFYGDMPSLSRQQLNENASHIRAFGGVPHHFTFSYPTQGTTVPTPRPSIQTTSSMPFAGALGPGLGTTWQHSSPSSIMSHTSSRMTSSVYTGMPTRSDPQPSCSSPVKRPKRKAVGYADDAPSSKVYLCTDQFANLNLNNDLVQNETKGHDFSGWDRFQEVENSIECDIDDDNKKKKREGVLRINDAITDAISSQTSDNILPRNVLKEIARPCMQVVLWKCPGERVRDLVREDSTTYLSTPSPSPSASHSLSSSATASPSQLSSAAFDTSSKFTPMSNHLSPNDSLSAPYHQTWLHQGIPNAQSPFSHRTSSQVPIQTSTLPQTEWNMLSSSSSLLVSKSKSSAVTLSQENPQLWDLNFVGKCDEEMQL